MDELSAVDIRQYSFDEFIEFIFDREIPPDTEKWDPWHWHTDVVFDPQRICVYYKRLFEEPGFLLERFSKAQLEEGFWGISNDILECSACNVLWVTDLPFAAREECVRSMFNLFSELFVVEPLGVSVWMWWDSLCWHLWHRGVKDRQRGGEDLSMQDVMFETLTEILALDSEHCQKSSLHGLGHLHHPATEEAIQDYIARRPLLKNELRDYALAAARFEVE